MIKSPKDQKKFGKPKEIFQKKQASQINSVFRDSRSFQKRFGVLTVHQKKISFKIEVILLLIEYMQLFAQTILLMKWTYSTGDLNSSQSLQNLYFVSKILLPGYFLDFNSNLVISCVIIALIMLFAALRGAFGLFAVKDLNKKNIESHLMIRIWRWLIKIYMSIGNFPFISASASFLRALFEYAQVSMQTKTIVYIAVCVIFIVTESAVNVYHLATKSLSLPSQSYIAVKNPSVRILTTVHQFILVVLQLTLDQNSRNAFWVLVIINFVLSTFTLYLHFKALTNYNVYILVYKGCLMTAFALFNFIIFIRALVLSTTNHRFGVDSAIIIFVIALAPVLKASFALLKKMIWTSVYLSPKSSNSLDLLIHKIFSINHFQKCQKDLQITKKASEVCKLTQNSILENIVFIFGVETKEKQLDLSRVFLVYLQNLLARFPKSFLIKLHLGFYYGKKLKMYRSAIKILTELEHLSKGSIQLSALLLKKNIELIMRNNYKTQNQTTKGIDLVSYIRQTVELTKLKQKIRSQASLQIKLCEEYKKDRPDISRIFDWAQNIRRFRSTISRKFKVLAENSPEYFIEPYLMIQGYEMMANHSTADFIKLHKMIIKHFQKHNRIFESRNLNAESLYCNENIFFVIQCQEENFGSVMHCSNSIQRTLGIEAKRVEGTNLLSMIPPAFRNSYIENITNCCEGKSQAMNNQFVSFISHNSGYIVEVDICMDIHPYMQQGIYVDILLRPTETNLDYLILSEDGRIIGFTERVGKKLGLEFVRAEIFIKQICAELDRVNKAFNTVASHFIPNTNEFNLEVPTKNLNESTSSFGKVHQVRKSFRSANLVKGTANYEEAIEIFNSFSSQGKHLYLTPYDPSNPIPDLVNTIQSGNKYKCKVENKTFGNQKVRLCTLEQVIRSDEEAKKKNESPGIARIENLMQTNPEKFKSFKILPISQRSSVSIKARRYSVGTSEDLDSSDSERIHTEIPTEKRPMYVPQASQGKGEKSGRTQRYSLFRKDTVGMPLSSTREGLMNSETSPRQEMKKLMIERNPSVEQKTLLEGSSPRRSKTQKLPENDHISMASSQVQAAAGMEKISDAYNQALSMKYYPRYFKAIMFLFGLTLSCLLAIRVSFSLIIVNNRVELSERKDIMLNAETKNFYLSSAQQLARSLWNFKTGDPDVSTDTFDRLKYMLQGAINGIAHANHAIRISTSSLSSKDLYFNNVRIYDNYFDNSDQTSVVITNFQATEVIINALDKIVTETAPSKDLYDFVYRNSLNDLLLTSQETANLYFKSLKDLYNQDKEMEIARFVVSIGVSTGIFFILTAVILVQYRNEVRSMEAFIRLRSIEVAAVQKRLENLQSIIQDELYWDEALDPLACTIKNTLVKDQGGPNNKSKEANYKKVTRKYRLHILKTFLGLVVLVTMYAQAFAQGLSVNQSLYNKLEQINYSKWMMGEIYISFTTLVELIATNDVAQIGNEPASSMLESSFESIDHIQETIASGFFEQQDGEYDPQIQNLLFGQACKYLSGFSLTNCLKIQNDGQNLNYVTILSNLRYYMMIVHNKYLVSNKSESALRSLRLETFRFPFSNVITVNDLNELISNKFIQGFEDSVAAANKRTKLILFILSAILVLVVFVLRKSVLLRIRELDNQLKNVLRVFPPELVLSNFIVKRYLQKTSKDAFNSILNNIS